MEITSFCRKRLPTSTINSAIDGYILGLRSINSSESEKLSNIIHDYYCPLKQSWRYNWSSRYQTFYDLSNPLSHYKKRDPFMIVSIALNMTSSLQGFLSPIKDFCLPYFMDVLWYELNMTRPRSKTMETDVCSIHENCQNCLFSEATSTCFWCEGSRRCFSNSRGSICSRDRVLHKTSCPNTCLQKQKCSLCVSSSMCGWCGSQSYDDNPHCTEGTPAGPRSSAVCNPTGWFHGACTTSCPVNEGRLCSGRGICKNGQCICVPGFYGKLCSKQGCVVRTKQNDTLRVVKMCVVKCQGS